MPHIFYFDKMGKRKIWEVEEGVFLINFLKRNKIPTHALLVLTIDQNKMLKLEDEINSDILILNMCNYNLETFLVHFKKPKIIHRGKDDIVFTKKICKFSKEGNIEPYLIQMDRNEFNNYYEKKLQKIIEEKCGISKDDRIAVGFSGGIDSSSFLLALNSLGLLDNFDIVAITVTGVPDAETVKGIQHTKYLTSKLKIPHIISKPNDIEEIFNLNKPFIEIINEQLKDPSTASKTIFIGHAVIRRILEEYSRAEHIKKICFCIEAEGVIANILSSLISGFPLLGIFKRKTPYFEYLYPLSTFTKSENLIYLFLNDKNLLKQEPSGEVHRRAPDLRTVGFVLFESLNATLPGVYEYIIEGTNKLIENFLNTSKIRTKKCNNCGGYFLEFRNKKIELCSVCQLLTPYITF